MKYIWLIPLLPGVGAAINGLLGIRYFSRKASGAIACATMIAALGLSLAAFWQLLGLPADARGVDVVVAQWIPSIPLATSNGPIGMFGVPGVPPRSAVGDDDPSSPASAPIHVLTAYG
jgi:hypothetical protein